MKVLVSVASKHGSTGEIGNVVAAELTSAGHDVLVAAPDSVTSLDGVDALVLGSAVYAGRWLKPARQLASRLEGATGGRPVWLLSSGPIGDPPMPQGQVDVAAVVRQTGAREHRVFAGRLDRAALSLPERALVRALKAPEGDVRDWDEIRAWARTIAAELAAEQPASCRPRVPRAATRGGRGARVAGPPRRASSPR